MENFFTKINAVIKKKPDNQVLAKSFLSNNNSNNSRFIIGKNIDSLKVCKLITIDGIIDDFDTEHSHWENIPIVKSSQIPSNAIVVNCSTSISPISVNKKLIASNIKNLLSYNEIVYASNGNLSMPLFVDEMLFDFEINSQKWLDTYNLLSDKESKKTFLDLICYRLTANISYMKDYSVRISKQYFEDFMHYKSEIFVDIGGFDGDTSSDFCRLYSDYKKVYFFEPSAKNMLSAKDKLKLYKNIEYISCGLSDENGLLSFNPDAGSASAFSESGTTTIEVSTLDLKVNEPVTFIKMDIEGWELKALKGCKNHIINDHPKLAIAIYHKAKDFYEIPNFILSLNPNYNIFIRHYTEGWSETVMFFLPKTK